jgi:hypothetical protein
MASSLLMGCTALLGSFEVQAEGATDPSGGGGDGGAPGSEAGGGGADSSVDAAIVCSTPGEQACGNVCAPLATSGDHCGACGHSCGGGVCEAGRCKPFELYKGATPVGPLAVSDAQILFSPSRQTVDPATDQNKLVGCPKTGCALAPQQIAVMSYPIDAVAVPAKGNVVFLSAPTQNTQRPNLYSCSVVGCPAPPPSFVADGLNGISSRLQLVGDRVLYDLGGSGLSFSTCLPGAGGCSGPTKLGTTTTRNTSAFSADAQHVCFVDALSRGGALSRCSTGDTACVPTVLEAGDHTDVTGTAIAAGKLFWTRPGRDGFNEGKLWVCDLPACATPKPLALGLNSPSDLMVDVSGAYWLTAAGQIQRCAPNGCLGGAQTLTETLVSPHSLVADEAFLYWAEKTTISRLAK